MDNYIDFTYKIQEVACSHCGHELTEHGEEKVLSEEVTVEDFINWLQDVKDIYAPEVLEEDLYQNVLEWLYDFVEYVLPIGHTVKIDGEQVEKVHEIVLETIK